jgi:hypothetical protein
MISQWVKTSENWLRKKRSRKKTKGGSRRKSCRRKKISKMRN